MIDLAHVKDDFPILRREVNGKRLVFLDSGASSQKPRQVIDAMDEFYRTSYANVHRGQYMLSQESTDAYELARVKVAEFIGAASPAEVAFQRGTTSALNTVAYGWGLNRLQPGDKIVLTLMEHHANIVPWQIIARHTGAELVYLPITDEYEVDISNLESIIDDRVKIVGVSAMSNVMGTLGPVKELVAAAHAVGAIVVCDGAQAVPHMPVDVQALGIDFLAFSAHKMLGPTGIGALWGRLELMEAMEPMEGGGEMIADVQLDHSTWAPTPHKFEAGTPPIAEAVGFGAAVDYLTKLGMGDVRSHEIDITAYALDQLNTIPDLKVYGPTDPQRRGGAVSFTLADIHAHDLATILDEEGIAVRAGHHCARPLLRSFGVPATARASFYVYSIREDVDALVVALHKAREIFGVA